MAADTVTPAIFFEEPFRTEAGNRLNDLFDVVALLDAAVHRMDEAASIDASDPMHNTLRLVQIAQDKVRRAIETFSEHV